MSGRNLSTEFAAKIAEGSVRIVELIKFNFSTPEYYTTAPRDVTYDGNSYLSAGDLLSVPDIKETLNISQGGVSITLSGVNVVNLYLAFTEDFTNVEVAIHKALLDKDFSLLNIPKNPVEVFFGVIDNYNIEENPISGTSSITWSITSHWSDFRKTAGRKTNDADQQKHYPGDLGLQFSGQNLGQIKWGWA